MRLPTRDELMKIFKDNGITAIECDGIYHRGINIQDKITKVEDFIFDTKLLGQHIIFYKITEVNCDPETLAFVQGIGGGLGQLATILAGKTITLTLYTINDGCVMDSTLEDEEFKILYNDFCKKCDDLERQVENDDDNDIGFDIE